jgi:hypothetical protein
VTASGAGGYLGDLEFGEVKSRLSELIPNPMAALWPFGRDFLKTLCEQWQRYSRSSVRWGVTLRGGGAVLIKGRSAGAAAAVGFHLLTSGGVYDRTCLLSAVVGDSGDPRGDRLHPVEEVPAKLRTAVSDGTIRRIGLARGQSALITQLRGSYPGIEMTELETVERAVDFASGLTGALMRYLAEVSNVPDKVQPVYLGTRKPSELYIEPDVIQWERKQKDARASERVSGAASTLMGAESRDIGEEEDVYAEDSAEKKRREPWQQERQKLHSGVLRCAVILGAPGQGKTMLRNMTARQLAQSAATKLIRQTASIHDVEIPVSLTFQELTATEIKSNESPEQVLRRILSDAAARSCGDEVQGTSLRSYLFSRIHEQRVWVLLDALDELAENRYLDLAKLLDVLQRWDCRLVMTSRPHGYGWCHLPFPKEELKEYRLATLAENQDQELVTRWYGQDELQRSQMMELLERNSFLGQLAQVPFLLTLLCWVGELKRIDPEIRRAELYRLIMIEMLGMSRDAVVSVNEARGEHMLEMLAPVVLSLYERNGTRKAFQRSFLRGLIADSHKRPVPSDPCRADLPSEAWAEELIKELGRKRLLVAVDDGQTQFVFPHRSIGEYLAGYALANELTSRRTRWRPVARWAWQNDWEQVVLFAAGVLATPPERAQPKSSKMLKRLLMELPGWHITLTWAERLAAFWSIYWPAALGTLLEGLCIVFQGDLTGLHFSEHRIAGAILLYATFDGLQFFFFRRLLRKQFRSFRVYVIRDNGQRTKTLSLRDTVRVWIWLLRPQLALHLSAAALALFSPKAYVIISYISLAYLLWAGPYAMKLALSVQYPTFRLQSFSRSGFAEYSLKVTTPGVNHPTTPFSP